MKTYLTFTLIGLIIFGGMAFLFGRGISSNLTKLGGPVSTLTNTWADGTFNSTKFVNVNATTVFTSTTKYSWIQNDTANKLSCFLEANGTTQSSSAAILHAGLVLGSSTIRMASFGECNGGSPNCTAFKGTVNCIASAGTVVSIGSK